MPKMNVERVRGAMLRKKWKRADLVAATGLNPDHVTNSLLAKNPLPMDRTKILAICEALDLSLEDVIADEQGADADAPEAAPAADEPTSVPTSMRGAA